MKQLTVSAWLLIFSAVAEPRISGKPAKSREIHNNVRNTAKFARNLIKYLSIQHIWNLFRLMGPFNCRNLANLPLPKLPGINYVAKHWPLVMMLKALPLAHFSSALLLEYVRLSLLKTSHTVVKSVQNQSISREICPENSHEIGCFSAKLGVKISAKSVSENPVKFYFRDLDRTILQGFWYQIWSFKNIADRSRYKFGDKLALFMRFSIFCMTKAKQEKMKFLF